MLKHKEREKLPLTNPVLKDVLSKELLSPTPHR